MDNLVTVTVSGAGYLVPDDTPYADTVGPIYKVTANGPRLVRSTTARAKVVAKVVAEFAAHAAADRRYA